MVMAMNLFFKAPWSQTLTVITAAVCVLLVGMGVLFVVLGIWQQDRWAFLWAVLPLLILGITALFMVQGYHIEGDRLLIDRLGWRTEIVLTDLKSATYDPTAMEGSLRVFGSGGLFAFTGKFWNKQLGFYDAYATAIRLTVVLKFPQKTVVVTPEKPEQFVEAILNLKR